MPLDYSKWDKIEVSDDEDDTHPNVDTPSLFRWRHQARIERESSLRDKRINIDKEGDKLKAKLAKSKNLSDEDKKKQLEDWKKRERDIAEEERKQPHSVDTLSKDSTSKTLISKVEKYEDYNKMTDEEKEASYKKFVSENKKLVEEFGMYSDPVASQQFLNKNRQLITEHTSNYLVVWCIDLEMDQKHELMIRVAKQTICMQFILELARGINRHPTECFPLFYQKFIEAQNLKNSKDPNNKKAAEYYQAFQSEYDAFVDRVEKRAKVKMAELIAEVEEDEEKERLERIKLSPGGIDPQEVIDELPEDLKKCFIERDTEMLQKLLSDKPTEEYINHIKRCVLSGLWVPGEDSPLYALIDPQRQEQTSETDVPVVEEKEEEQKITEIEEVSDPKIEKMTLQDDKKNTKPPVDELDID